MFQVMRVGLQENIEFGKIKHKWRSPTWITFRGQYLVSSIPCEHPDHCTYFREDLKPQFFLVILYFILPFCFCTYFLCPPFLLQNHLCSNRDIAFFLKERSWDRDAVHFLTFSFQDIWAWSWQVNLFLTEALFPCFQKNLTPSQDTCKEY